MCRLALMNKKGMRMLDKMYGLDKFLLYLEAQLGGHGNGYIALDKNGKIINGLKGVDVSTERIATEMLVEEKAEWLVFHTRLASMGSISTPNCHPFWNKNLTAFLCANGTERGVEVLLNKKAGETDTETVFKMGLANKDGLLAKVKTMTAVYIGKQDNKLFAVRNNGSLDKVEFADGGIVLASSFPYGLREKAKQENEFVVEFANE